MSWEKVKFSKLYEIPSRNGLTKPSKVRGTGYKMINMGELFANNRIYDIPMELVPLTDSEKKNCKVERNDLLFARQSLVLEGAGKCSIVMKSSSMTVFESHLIRIRLNRTKAHPMFYYYYFLSPCSPIKSIVSQCAQAGIRGSELGELYVELPPLATQRRIADILSAYDDLIENNRKQIKLLEEAAQRLYKEWFVDLRFPGHEHTRIVDGVPEGWKNGCLSQIAEFKRGKTITKAQIKPGTIPVVAGGLEPAYYHNVANTKAPVITISASGANAGFTRMYHTDVFASDCSFIEKNTCACLPFVYCFLINHKSELDSLQKGSAQPHVYAKDINALQLCLPNSNLLNKFCDFSKRLFLKIGLLEHQSTDLTQARDHLLPKLMSGEMEM